MSEAGIAAPSQNCRFWKARIYLLMQERTRVRPDAIVTRHLAFFGL
jgi:hypothetical protein